MKNRVENVSVFVFLGLSMFVLIKLIIFIISFFQTIRIDTAALASMS